jgi:biopolymer transport protein ExbD
MFRRRLQPVSEFSLASIADIVFLLLIYFLLTSSFVSQAGIEVRLPQSSSQQPTKGPHSITITARGEWYWDNQRTSKEALPNLVRQALQSAGNDPNARTISVRADEAVTVQELAYALSLIAENRGQVVIATRRP